MLKQFEIKSLETLPDLPDMVLDFICDHLSYEDVLALRSTCKRLKGFVCGKKFTKLNLFIQKFSCHYRLFYEGGWINYTHSLHSNSVAILSRNSFKEGGFYRVRRMIICSPVQEVGNREKDVTYFDLSCLNFFSALNHLEIDQMNGIEGRLDLQELQIAAFAVETRRGFFELHCPKLKALKIRNCMPTLTTNRINHLYWCDNGDPSNYLKKNESNLQKLSTNCFKTIKDLLRLLSALRAGSLSLPSLSELQLDLCEDLERLNDLVSSLEDLKRNTQLKRIELTLNGRSFRSLDELQRIASLTKKFNGNYYHLGTLSCLNRDSATFLNNNPELNFLLSTAPMVHFDVGPRAFTDEDELIVKLTHITHLRLEHPYEPSESTMELFIRTCKSLRSLAMLTSLSKRTLELMSNSLVNLEKLQMRCCFCETVEPVANFRNLIFFQTDRNVSKRVLTFIYENNRTLKAVRICGRDEVTLTRTITAPKTYKIIAMIFLNLTLCIR